MVGEERFKNSMAGARTGVIVNIFLVLVKGSVGILSGSMAMLADALHSAADITASAVVYIGIRVASKPADDEHPYGHGKAESIAGKIVAIIIILAGLNIGAFSLRALFHVAHPAPGSAALWAALLSVAVKEGLFRHTYRIGRQWECRVLVANAYEHRSDAISSLAALAGIGGARLGLLFNRPQLFFLDPLAGIVVAVFIVRMGWKIAGQAASELMDGRADPSLIAELSGLVLDVSGVVELHEVRARAAGPHYLVDLEIGVDGKISVMEGHDIAASVKECLLREKAMVADVLIHVNPCRAQDNTEKEGLTEK
ncbi:MAG: cation transporter [Dethiobacter sp.]|nr:cation transporter [Dethiobacter sp.]